MPFEMAGEGKAGVTSDQNNQPQCQAGIASFSLKHPLHQTNFQIFSSENANTTAGVCICVCGVLVLIISSLVKG